jgi:hypothetical protein
VEFIIVGAIVIIAGYLLYSNIKKQANGDCGCGKGCNGCETKPPVKKDDKIQ